MKLAYIFDIDGTLADCKHRLHFIQGEKKNWDAFFNACEDDKPIWDVIQVAKSIAARPPDADVDSLKIVYLTGRPEKIRSKTEDWLHRYGCPKGLLVMRADGDHRPDFVAKKKLLEDLIGMGYRVAGIFEDRPSVVRVWRRMGMTVFQMTEEEF